MDFTLHNSGDPHVVCGDFRSTKDRFPALGVTVFCERVPNQYGIKLSDCSNGQGIHSGG